MGLKDKIKSIIEENNGSSEYDYRYDRGEQTDYEADKAMKALALLAVRLKDMTTDQINILIDTADSVEYDEAGYLFNPSKAKVSKRK